MSAKLEMTPVQCKEHMDELLELQQEEGDLRRKAEKAAEVHKNAKAAHELKENEIITLLAGLNQELPLFDNPEDVPFPFPLPADTHEATLGNVATDPTVLGLSVGVVKQVHEAIGVRTLGQLEKYLGATEKLSVDKEQKAKKELGKKIGPNQAVKLLRAVASFTGNRKKVAGKKEAAPAPIPAKSAAKTTMPPADYRDTPCSDLEELSPLQAKTLNQLDLDTLGKALDRLDAFNKEAPENPPKDYLAKRLATTLGIKDPTAGEIIKNLYLAEEKFLVGEKA